MRSDTPLDYAVFQLSPERSRCELFVSGNGSTEKLASGLLKPFVTHLAVAEEQVAQDAQSIKLEVEKCNEGNWFTKGTIERFVRFVSTPEVLELVHTFDAEMSQLEAARRIYLQGSENQLSSDSLGADERGASAVADITKKELLRAIDMRLAAVRQDLTMACARASSAGFTPDTVPGLQLFSDQFGAHRLNEACIKFISVNQRRPDLITPWKARVDDRAVRSSSGSDMSADDQSEENVLRNNGSHKSLPQRQHLHRHHQRSQSQINQEQDAAQYLEESEASTCQQLKTFANFSAQRSLRESSSERDECRENEGTVEKEETTPEAPQTSKLLRRLSVQDRINMFENKQKEQTQGSGGKVMVGKSVELRRLSSDVSSAGQLAEKAVLRRWSGVSDMSLDVSIEKKEAESSESTPGSTYNRRSQSFPSASEDSENGASQEKAKSYESKRRGLPVTEHSGVKDGVIAHNQVEDLPTSKVVVGSKECSSKADGLSDQLVSQSFLKACSTRTKDVDWKDHADLNNQPPSQARFGSCGTKSIELKKDSALQTLAGASSTGADHAVPKDQVDSQLQFRAFFDHAEEVSLNDQTVSQVHSKASINRTDDLVLGDEPQEVPQNVFPSRVTDGRSRDQLASQATTRASPSSIMNVGSDSKEKLVSQLQSRPFSGKVKGGLGEKTQAASLAQYGFVGELSVPQIPRSLEEKIEEAGNMEFGGLHVREEDYSVLGIKLQRQSSAPEQNSKFRGRNGRNIPTYGNSGPIFSQRKVIESTERNESIPAEISDQVQKIRLTKGNQELNDELQVKANELEMLFAAHKLRVPADQSTTTRRSKPVEMQTEQVSSTIYSTPSEVSQNQFSVRTTMREPFDSDDAIMRTPGNQEFRNALKQNISEPVFPENSRGKFYDSYMQKRNAKLREECSLKRDQKEAKMKAMQDSFEQSRVEMEAKFAGSSDRRESSLYARQRAEKLRSFNMRLIKKNREQHPIDILRLDGDGDSLEFSEQNQYDEQAGSFSERLMVNGSSKFFQSKKALPSRNPSSSTIRNSAAPVPRSSTKSSNSSSGRRRVQAENPLAQSVPNFSDFRKENTKPSPGISKTTTRTQFRNYARSKSSSEESPVIKEDKSQCSQSMRKSFVIPGDLKDLSPLNSDDAILAQLKCAKEQVEPSLYGKLSRNGESKPFLKKGNGIGPGARAGIAKLKASMTPEILKTDEESGDMTDQLEDFVDLVKDEEGCEREMVDEALQVVDYATDSDNENLVMTDSDNENLVMSRESENYGDPTLGNRNILGSFCQVDPDSVAEVAAAVPSKFYSSMRPQQDSPGESPISWNSQVLHPFSYTHETSDVDASIDSPIGSPASSNSHSLTEADAARMRKKWGSAQKPILLANSSNHQSRKDVTRGFKRLLKFGRKSRGTESLVDWISATTSEGDDDTEDGRDLANRSSEDLRKSRMGLSQDMLNDGELFNEQVQALCSSIPTVPSNFKLREDHLSGSSVKAPRSFFSLSTFRSKGTESKPR